VRQNENNTDKQQHSDKNLSHIENPQCEPCETQQIQAITAQTGMINNPTVLNSAVVPHENAPSETVCEPTRGLINNGLTWLHVAPKIELLPEKDKSPPYPLSWAEQPALLKELPKHLAQMALFKVNTGCRDHEVCNLQWNWEIPIPELNTSVFLVPSKHVKNGEDRLVVLNDVAKSIIDEVRDENP